MIRVLGDDLANQIAAGEVVERPASVVKELVENAVDAGARRVRIDVEQGGLGRVRVADDGSGMDRADAELSVVRHATSKIQELADLSRLASFGFRGEALPSIASVSRFVMRTRRAEDDEGTEVRVDGGGAPAIAPCGCAPGTTIDVEELFFNVPARRKFVRAVGTEAAHVTEVAQTAALADAGLTLILARDGRVVREWLRAASREERVRAAHEGEELAACRGARGPLAVEAFLSRPERARSGAGWLGLFVNGRPVRDRALARAVASAYGSVLEPGRYPIGVVYLELPRELVDVNVHPQKAEVRFADGRAVADALHRVLADALRASFSLPADAGQWGKKQRLDDPGPQRATGPWAWSASAPLDAADPWGLSPALDAAGASAPMAGGAPGAALDSVGPLALMPSTSAPALATSRSPFATLRFVAQVRSMFLICEGPDGLYVLDQHAAAERVTFHRLRSAYLSRAAQTQALLFPVVVEVSASESALAEEAHDEALRIGLDVRPAGPSAVAIHAVPALLGRASPERLVRDLLGELGRTGERAFSATIDLALATMACHGSTRAGDAVSPAEAAALLAALDEVDFAGHCPHGRPIVTRLGWGELEQRVGRR